MAPDSSELPSDEAVRRSRISVSRDGSFDFYVRGVASVRVVAWHPGAAASRVAKVDAETEAIVLRLEPPTNVVRFSPDIEIPSSFARRGSFRVLQFEGADRLQPVGKYAARLVGGRLQFCNVRPGVSTLFIDPPSELRWREPDQAPEVVSMAPRVPVVLENVDVREGAKDLGNVSFPQGSTLEIRLPLGWPPRVSPLRVVVEALDAPGYVRTTTTADLVTRLPGLRQGKFRVAVSMNEWAFEFERTIRADGVNPVVVLVDSPTSN